MQHLDEGLAHAWIDGALPSEEGAWIEAHVAACAACAALVADARGVMAGASRIVSSLDVVRGNVVPGKAAAEKSTRPRSLWTALHLTPARAALAAAVLIAVASVLANGRRERPATRRLGDSAGLTGDSATRRLGDSARQQRGHPERSEGSLSSRRDPSVATLAQDDSHRGHGSRPSIAARPRNENKAVGDSAPLAEAAVTATASAPQPASAARFSAESLKARDVGPGGRTPPAQRLEVNAVNATAQRMQSFARRAGVAAPITCYEVSPESIAVRASMPPRFALERGVNGEPNVVALVSPAGSLASPIEGSSWAELPNGMIRVNFASARSSLSISGLSARATWGADSADVRITRRACGG